MTDARASALDQRRWARRAFLAVVGLVVVFRLAALLSWRPGGYVVDWTERYFFQGWLRYVDAGYLPYLDFWMEYPPLLPFFGIAAYWLSQSLPPWQDPTLWFSITTGVPLLVAEVATLALIWAIARRLHGDITAALAAAMFSALLIPLYFWLSGFDGPALTLLLLAVWLALPRADSPRSGALRAVAAGVAIGLGMQYKLVPVAVLPVVTLAFWFGRRRWAAVAGVVACAVTNLAVTAPLWLLNPTMVTASYASILARSSWETVWALLDGYYGGGLVAPIDQRFDPATATVAQHASSVPGVVPLAVTVAAFGVALLRRWDWRSPLTVMALAAYSLLALLLGSKGYSAQFLVYPLALVAILWPNQRGAVYAALLTTINVLEWPIWLAMFGENAAVLTALVLGRTMVFLALAAECVAALGVGRPLPKLARSAATGLAALSLVVGVVALGVTYYRDSYREDPYRNLYATLARDGGVVVFTDRTLYEKARPVLGWRQRVVLAADPPVNIWRDLVPSAGPITAVTLVFAGTDTDRRPNAEATAFLSQQLAALDEQWLDNARVTRFVRWQGVFTPIDDARFGDQIALVAKASPITVKANEPFGVLLRWRALGRVATDYSVYLHVYDETGALAAQRDGAPVAGARPTSTWAIDETIEDSRALVVARPGTYRLRAGLYDSAGRRVMLASGADGVDLGPLTVAP